MEYPSSLFYSFLVLLVVLRWRLAPAFRNLAERVSSRRSLQLIIFAPLLVIGVAAILLQTMRRLRRPAQPTTR